MKVLTYNDMKIEMHPLTRDPNKVLKRACHNTMKNLSNSSEHVLNGSTLGLVQFLIEAEHTSVFEHIVFTFEIQNVSRSFLAQITRHRMGSFTSSSQHYQDYRDYPVVVHPSVEAINFFTEALDNMIHDYTHVVDQLGVPVHEARQILPNAAAVNLIWTVNLRSLMNFWRQRCCNRNVDEMRIFANRSRQLVVSYWPVLEGYVGPPCYATRCNQGKMQCEQGEWNASLDI